MIIIIIIVIIIIIHIIVIIIIININSIIIIITIETIINIIIIVIIIVIIVIIVIIKNRRNYKRVKIVTRPEVRLVFATVKLPCGNPPRLGGTPTYDLFFPSLLPCSMNPISLMTVIIHEPLSQLRSEDQQRQCLKPAAFQRPTTSTHYYHCDNYYLHTVITDPITSSNNHNESVF